MKAKAPPYPGYKAAECNGCGQCCLTLPCNVSAQFDLWRDGKCRALRFAAGRYWCDALVDPRRVSVALSKKTKAERADALGTGMGCDHRCAPTPDQALALLAERNIADEIAGITEDSYPRGAIFNAEDGAQYVITIASPEHQPIMQQVIAGRPSGKAVRVKVTE